MWHSKGGHFNLSPTAEEGWREHLELLESTFGRIKRASEGGTASATRVLYEAIRDAAKHVETARAVMGAFFYGALDKYHVGARITGSGMRGSPTISVTPEMAARVAAAPTDPSRYKPSYIPYLVPPDELERWQQMQSWLLLSIADGAPGPVSSSADATLREMWDPLTGTFVVERGSSHFTTTKEQWDDLVSQGSHSVKSYSAAGQSPWGNNKTQTLIPYNNVLATYGTDITGHGIEYEWLVRNIRPDDVVTIVKRHMTAREVREWWAAHKPRWA
jgi:hypothetical protein